MRLSQQPVKIIHGAKNRVNIRIIGDIVPEVYHGGWINRGDPDRPDSKPLQVVQPVDDAGQVTDAVAIRILKRARVNLINNPCFPPGVSCCRCIHIYDRVEQLEPNLRRVSYRIRIETFRAVYRLNGIPYAVPSYGVTTPLRSRGARQKRCTYHDKN